MTLPHQFIRLLFIAPQRFVVTNGVIVEAFEHEGFDTTFIGVAFTPDFRKILAFLADSPWQPDVIVVNEYDHLWDGVPLIEGIRRMSRHRSTPIIALSSDCDMIERDRLARAKRHGATEAFALPVQPADLYASIRQVTAA